MKEKEGIVDCPDQQMILYVEKDDGQYGPIQTGSYLTANYLDDFFLKRKNLESTLREQLINGTISIVKYFMVLEDLSLSELAARAAIRKSRVRKHLDPSGFAAVTAAELSRYARVFNVPMANLLQVVLIKNKEQFESAMILENRTDRVEVIQEQSGNPYVVLTKLSERT